MYDGVAKLSVSLYASPICSCLCRGASLTPQESLRMSPRESVTGCVYIYIYIYRERERDIYIYIYICIHTHVLRCSGRGFKRA